MAHQRAARELFLSLYPNRVGAILRPRGCKSWTTISKHFPLPDEQLIKAIALADTETVWGCRWGQSTRFGVLDIDEGSKYHTVAELQKLTERLAAVGLTGTAYQSSTSGGWHVYLFFDSWCNSGDVEGTLRTWLRANGYEIRNGVLELFPSGNGLRLPLQQGFGWLAPDGSVHMLRQALTMEQALARFLTDLSARASDWTSAKSLIESQLQPTAVAAGELAQEHQKAIDTDGFDGLWNYRLIPEKYEAGRGYWQSGLTANGQRHEAILCVEHYLWHGDESLQIPAFPGSTNDHARFALIRAWLEAKHNGFCNHVRRGNWHKVEAQIKRACLWRRSSDRPVRVAYPMTDRAIERLVALYKATGRVWSMDDFRKGNEGRREIAREKIRAALELLLLQGRKITLRQLVRLSGCNHHTVKRHADLWQVRSMFSSVASELNPLLDPNISISLFSSENTFPPSCADDSGNHSPSEPADSVAVQSLPTVDAPGQLFVIPETYWQKNGQQSGEVRSPKSAGDGQQENIDNGCSPALIEGSALLVRRQRHRLWKRASFILGYAKRDFGNGSRPSASHWRKRSHSGVASLARGPPRAAAAVRKIEQRSLAAYSGR